MQWTSDYRFVADDPAKALGRNPGLGGSDVLAILAPVMEDATSRITVISPYFVPGKDGTKFMLDQVARGTEVRVLTNSLAANDVPMVYGGYSKTRPELLAGGVKLWELKPLPGSTPKKSAFGSSGASLHTKALAADSGAVSSAATTSIRARRRSIASRVSSSRRPRSRASSKPCSSGRRRPNAHGRSPATNGLRWSDGVRRTTVRPEATGGQKFQAWIAKVLPLDSQL